MEILKIQSLSKGWHDRDEILLHSVFQVLVDYIEKEHPDKVIDWNTDEEYRHAWEEIQELYKWWKEERPEHLSPLEDKQLTKPPLKFRKIPGSEFSQAIEPDRKKYATYYKALAEYSRLEQKWFDEDQRNLHRLIQIRSHLWT
jgi:hypothetical protein